MHVLDFFTQNQSKHSHSRYKKMTVNEWSEGFESPQHRRFFVIKAYLHTRNFRMMVPVVCEISHGQTHRAKRMISSKLLPGRDEKLAVVAGGYILSPDTRNCHRDFQNRLKWSMQAGYLPRMVESQSWEPLPKCTVSFLLVGYFRPWLRCYFEQNCRYSQRALLFMPSFLFRYPWLLIFPRMYTMQSRLNNTITKETAMWQLFISNESTEQRKT